MSAVAKYMKEFAKLEGAVKHDYNPFAFGLRSKSPSLNFTFGRSHLLPLGYTLVCYGVPKGGKTVVANQFIGQMHHDYEDGIALKYDTEFREELQNADLTMDDSVWGIDTDRYMAFSINTPQGIFDAIETDVAKQCENGAPVKLVVIDSINQIQGRRQMNNTSVTQQTIGDLAQTLQEGFKRILPVQRKHRFSVIITAHVRAEMDLQEQMRGNKMKMGAAYGVQHYGEFFMFVEPVRSKEGNKDAMGREFTDESKLDMLDHADKTGHKIRVCMKGNSAAPAGRVGEFTLDYARGVINQHEEVFDLGVNRGIILRPTNQQYVFGEKKWNKKEAILDQLAAEPALQEDILKVLREQDARGRVKMTDEEAKITAKKRAQAAADREAAEKAEEAAAGGGEEQFGDATQ